MHSSASMALCLTIRASALTGNEHHDMMRFKLPALVIPIMCALLCTGTRQHWPCLWTDALHCPGTSGSHHSNSQQLTAAHSSSRR
jgi:hypothetical protein